MGPSERAWGIRGRVLALLVGAGMLGVVGTVSPIAMLVVLRDGAIAAGVVIAATGLGLWIVRGLGLDRVDRSEGGLCSAAPLRWVLLLGAGLGLGAVSLLVLGLGALGWLNRWVWVVLLVLFALGGLWRVRGMPALRDGATGKDAGDDLVTADGWMRWLWLGVIGFGGLALVAGTMPPGILWPAEGNGYDVLEYHLGVPREHFEAGRISYLPHNIYGNFPMNVEMLYLLTIVLHGDPVSAVFTAKLLNVLLGMLVVAAVWLAGREYGRGGGIVAGLIAASCPFLTYLCGVAYVENGLLFYSALALGALLHVRHAEAKTALRWSVAAGLLCGLACGCKYTALPMVLLPLLLAVAWRAVRRRPRRPLLPAAFLLGWAVAFGPWLVKNGVATGNPVFPLTRNVLPERAGIWNEDGAARWHVGHLPAPEDRPPGRRLVRLWQEVMGAGLLARPAPAAGNGSARNELVGSTLFGPAIGLAVLAGLTGELVRLRRRPERAAASGTGLCWLMLAGGLVFWSGWTHLAGRFAIVLVVPAAVIAGWSWGRIRGPLGRKAGAAVLVAVMVVNLAVTVRLLTDPPFLSFGAFGRADWMTAGILPSHRHVPRLNALVADGHKVLVVGDARRFYLDNGVDYCVVFNRNPFAEVARAASPADVLAWLAEQGYDYVYVDWGEMRRLRASRYGFWPGVDEALFRRLMPAGLKPIEEFVIEQGRLPYATLFEVRRDGS